MSMVRDLDALIMASAESELGTDGNVWIDWNKREFSFAPFETFTSDGLSLQALYSFLINKVYKNNDELDPYYRIRFMMSSTTPTKMEMLYGWTFKTASDRAMVHDGGLTHYGRPLLQKTDVAFVAADNKITGSGFAYCFQAGKQIIVKGAANTENNGIFTISTVSDTEIVIDESGTLVDEGAGAVIDVEQSSGDDGTDESRLTSKWMGIKTIAVNATDVLYSQTVLDGVITDASNVGPMNEMVQIYGDVNNGDFTTDYFKIYNRSYGREYVANTNEDMGYKPLEPTMYYFALPTAEDSNIVDTDATVSGWNMSYTELSGTETATIDDVDYEYNIKVECDGHTTNEIWEWMQWYWRTDGVRKKQDTVVEYVAGQLSAKSGYSIWFTNMENSNATKLSVRGRTTANDLFGYTESANVDIMVTPPQDGCEVRIYEASTNDGELSNGTELLGYENWDFDSNGYCTWSYDYVADKNCVLQMMVKGYKEVIKTFVAGDADQVLSYDLFVDKTS